ncbi:hypothetical protein HAU38_05330 [Weissella confusa]|uniref:hypothetical protein n=1 Tax=Weissella confusa TaxID=1583 RepID=UPI0018F20052|nr:hypothetical protein [Weissella confusa]MBJ7675571.1 hypothetical protein [Weissella confusa]
MTTAVVIVIAIVAIVIDHRLSSRVINELNAINHSLVDKHNSLVDVYNEELALAKESNELNHELMLQLYAYLEMFGVTAEPDDLSAFTEQVRLAAVTNGYNPDGIGPKFFEWMSYKHDHGTINEATWQSVLAMPRNFENAEA